MEIFDGREEARKIQERLMESGILAEKRLMIFQCDGSHEESTYVRLKREMGEKLGVWVMTEILKDKEELRKRILEVDRDLEIEGILVQLPIMGADRGEVEQILSTINPDKDVDGLNPKSSFVPAVIRAVENVLYSLEELDEIQKIAVVGAKGMVGVRLVDRLRKLGFEIGEFDKGDKLDLKDYDVVVATTGVEGVIKADMVKDGFVGIDLGYPAAEISKEAAEKASLITPVPGGIGPMTIIELCENLGDSI